MMKIVLVVAARPNFMKIAPIWAELAQEPEVFEPVLVHTGQHYDARMSDVFLQELGLPEPLAFPRSGTAEQPGGLWRRSGSFRPCKNASVLRTTN